MGKVGGKCPCGGTGRDCGGGAPLSSRSLTETIHGYGDVLEGREGGGVEGESGINETAETNRRKKKVNDRKQLRFWEIPNQRRQQQTL